MKKLDKGMTIFLALTLAFALILPTAIKVSNPNYVSGDYVALEDAKNGTYTGSAKGFGGMVTADVTIKDGKIESITVDAPNETENLGTVAADKVPTRVVNAQSLDVELVGGATVTSNAVISAINQALGKANVDGSALINNNKGGSVVKTEKTLEVDIVVVGAGGAGMTAAITAKQDGKNVIILEKMPYVGGNTTKATGGMNAAETHYQSELGITDTIEQYVEDTMVGGKNINDKELVTVMAQQSSSAIDWLDSIGAPLPKVSFSGGATNARIHSPEDGSGVGEYLVNSFSRVLSELDIPVYLETKATELCVDADGTVIGVIAESEDTIYTIKATAVVLATGGYGANEEMYCSYRPDLAGSVTTNTPAATGDGIIMAEVVDAALRDMDQIQLHPTVEQDTKILITEGVRGDGAILVNQSGVRFVNEMLTRDKVSAAELAQEGSYAYVIFDQNLRDGLKAVEKYVKNNIVVQADTIEELATLINIDPATLKNTLDTWNSYVANGSDPDFGRDTGMEANLSVGPYYAIKIAPGIHHTMGGIVINTNTEVINNSGEIVKGLFAAGEVTGGVHGGNRLGGNAVTDIVVYGRIAGQNASKYVDEH